MLALARKYRPRNFASVAVQTHVSNTLKGAIARGRVAHGYLLCGPRGVGKTTLARVLAMALNCERRRAAAARLAEIEAGGVAAARAFDDERETLMQQISEPCGECESCRRIWSGSASLDVVEIDAASNRGVDDARELRERALYAPSGDDRYKVYIVDEAHMLTREAWNALLKILEEPPPRVVFVFATTEPQKIAQSAAPVLSRLQRFDLKRMGAADVRERLTEILREEQIDVAPDALALIARAADGSMRDALSLTDQALALGDGTLSEARVRETLGLVPEDEYVAILDILADRRAGDVFSAVGRLVEQGVDLGSFLAGLADVLRAQLAVTLGATELEVSDRTRAALEERRGRLAAGDLLRMLAALTELEPRFRKSGQQQLLLETLLVRFALLDRAIAIEEVLRGIGGEGGSSTSSSTGSRQESGSGDWRSVLGAKGSPPRARDPREGAERVVSSPAAPVRADAPSPPRREPEARPPRSDRSADRGDGRSDDRGEPRAMAAGATAVAVAPPPPRAAPMDAPRAPRALPSIELNALAERWDDVIERMRASNRVVASALQHAMPVAVNGSGAILLDVEDAASEPVLAAHTTEVLTAIRGLFTGVERIALKSSATAAPARRLTHEAIREERVAAMRKRDPVLGAAIDALDLELLD